MQNNNQSMNIAVIVSLIIGGSILGYGYLNYKTKMETLEKEQKYKTTIYENEQKLKNEALKREKTAEIDRMKLYLACNEDAQSSYELTWNKNCSSWGMGKGCLLPAIVSKSLDEVRQRNLDNCLKLYSSDK